MATLAQLKRKPRFGSKKKKRDSRVSLLSGNPQKKPQLLKCVSLHLENLIQQKEK